MAIGDPYASPTIYRAAVDKKAISEDVDELERQLKAVSRYLDRKLRMGRDGFNVVAAAEDRRYDGNGKAKLWLPDDISTATGLVLKVDLNADYDYGDADETLTLDADFWVGPDNADKGAEPEPYQWVEVHPNSGKLAAWPEQRKALEITAKWGWPAVPEAIVQAVIVVTHTLRDLEASTGLRLEAIDNIVQVTPRLSGLVRDLAVMYGRPGRT